MVLFKIGTTDITSYLNTASYVVNKEPVFTSWTDGNGIEHRAQIRNRITGTIVAGFETATALASFMTLISGQIGVDGYYSVTAYINNTNTTETFNAFLDLAATARWNIDYTRQWHEVTITITQR